MRTRRRWTRVSLAMALGTALSVWALAGPALSQTVDPACSQEQEVFDSDPGPSTFTSHGTTRFTESQVDANASAVHLGGGVLTWNVEGIVFAPNTESGGGDLAGYFTWAVDWDQDRPNTTFHSSCVELVVTQTGLVATVVEGTIHSMPSELTLPDPSDALAAIVLKKVRAGVADLFFIAGRRDEPCTFGGPSFQIDRPEARAPGSKDGNGGRNIVGC